MADSDLKLYYFDGRGRGELARLLLAAAGKKYEDIRFKWDEWLATYKPLAPFGQAPFLEVDGKRFAQSFAIANFLAREFNYFGKSNMDALAIEQVQGLVKDITELWVDARFAVKDEFPDEQMMEKLNKEHYPRFLGFFEKLLKENGTGYFVGDSLTVADFSVYDVSEEPVLHIPGILKSYPQGIGQQCAGSGSLPEDSPHFALVELPPSEITSPECQYKGSNSARAAVPCAWLIRQKETIALAVIRREHRSHDFPHVIPLTLSPCM